MGSTWVQVVVVVGLTLVNGLFAASEIAVVSARRGRLQQRAEAGNHNARIALQLAEDPNRFLATVQVGMTTIGVFTGAFGGSVLAEPLANVLRPVIGSRADTLAFTLVVLLITYLSLIIGELVPKRLALQHAEAIALVMAPVMRRLSQLAAPVVWFLSASTQIVLRLLGRSNNVAEHITEDDILSLVREGTEEGTVQASERELIERVFHFSDATVRSIMTPRTEIVALPIETSLHEARQRVIESGYSRVPVYRGSLDTVAGMLYVKDLLRLSQQPDEHTRTLEQLPDLLRAPVFALEHQRIATVLQQFKHTHTHMAMVLDEYGQVDGVVTLEDVLEELAGDIADEHDEAVDASVVARPDGSFLVDAMLSYADAAQRLHLPDRETLDDLPHFETMAGLVLALLNHIPTVGETLTWRDWHVEVVDLDGVRIDKLLVRPLNAMHGIAQNEAVLASSAVLPLVSANTVTTSDEHSR